MLHSECCVDAVVVGGGPAGCAAAITLVRAGWSVLLIDRQQRPSLRVGESLPPAVKPLLHDLGLSAVLADGHLPSYGNQSAWGSAALQDTDFIRDPQGHGWRLDRDRFDAALRAAAGVAGAKLWQSVRVRAVQRIATGWHVQIDRMPAVHARWVIDASGRSAWLARSQGATIRRYDRLIAFAARFCARLPGDRDTRTLVESVADGWWYSARVPDDQRVVVFHCDAGSPAAHLARTPSGFADLLARTGHIRQGLQRWQYALAAGPQILAAGSTQLDPPIGQQWVAVGDAALAFDPLASQGIMNGLYTGMQAAQTLVAMRQGDSDAERVYCARLQAIYRHYLHNKADYYAAERRWADRPFWAARSEE